MLKFKHDFTMKLFLILFSLSHFSALAVEPPQNYNNSRYYHLWQNSLVTDKPDPVKQEEVPNDLQDWVLVGTRKTLTGRQVTIMNTKDQSRRLVVPSQEATDLGFSILEVKQDPGNFTRTEVKLKKGGFNGWVKYDQQFLALKKAAVQPNQGNRNIPNGNPNRNVRNNSRNQTANRGGNGSNINVRGGAANVPPIPGLNNGGSNVNRSAGGTGPQKTTNKRRARVRYVPKPKK